MILLESNLGASIGGSYDNSTLAFNRCDIDFDIHYRRTI